MNAAKLERSRKWVRAISGDLRIASAHLDIAMQDANVGDCCKKRLSTCQDAARNLWEKVAALYSLLMED